jgi:hypothetical protein
MTSADLSAGLAVGISVIRLTVGRWCKWNTEMGIQKTTLQKTWSCYVPTAIRRPQLMEAEIPETDAHGVERSTIERSVVFAEFDPRFRLHVLVVKFGKHASLRG